MIPDVIIDQIRDANDIVEVISAYLPLKKKGREFVALCPFHNEKTPSFNVIPQKQIFYCFGCHKGGDVFKFLCEYEHIPYPEAIRRLGERAGIEVPEDNSVSSLNRSVKESMLRIHEEFTQYWHRQLLSSPEGQIARDYLAKRGVSEQSIEDFRLGYTPKLWEDTPVMAQRLHLDMDHLVESGLALARQSDGKNSSGLYGRFRGRLMFPICNDQGQVIAFSARVLYPDDKMGKYVNSPETPLFHKGKVIYGLDRAKREITEKKFSIICEGQLDLISCHAAGFRNAVAPQGTAFTEDQARLLKRFAPEVVLCFDGDNAGQNAVIKAFDILIKSELSMKVLFLPDQHDPDSFIKAYGAEAFGKLLNTSRQFFDFYLAYLCQHHNKDSDTGRLQIVQAMGEALNKADQPLLTDTYAQKTANLLNVSTQTILDQFKRIPQYSERRYAEAPAPEQFDDAGEPMDEEEFIPPSKQDRWLLKLLLMNKDQWDRVCQCFQPEWVENKSVREIITYILDLHTAGDWSQDALLKAFPSPNIQQLLYEILVQTVENIPEKERQLKELLMTLRNKHCNQLLRNINQQLLKPGISLDEQLQLLQQKERIRQIKSTPLI